MRARLLGGRSADWPSDPLGRFGGGPRVVDDFVLDAFILARVEALAGDESLARGDSLAPGETSARGASLARGDALICGASLARGASFLFLAFAHSAFTFAVVGGSSSGAFSSSSGTAEKISSISSDAVSPIAAGLVAAEAGASTLAMGASELFDFSLASFSFCATASSPRVFSSAACSDAICSMIARSLSSADDVDIISVRFTTLTKKKFQHAGTQRTPRKAVTVKL